MHPKRIEEDKNNHNLTSKRFSKEGKSLNHLRAQFLHMFHRQSQQLSRPPQHLQGSCSSVDHMPG
jgi:hypothetical protein